MGKFGQIISTEFRLAVAGDVLQLSNIRVKHEKTLQKMEAAGTPEKDLELSPQFRSTHCIAQAMANIEVCNDADIGRLHRHLDGYMLRLVMADRQTPQKSLQVVPILQRIKDKLNIFVAEPA